MAKVVLFSDLHAHPFSNYATILPNGMNSRLADAVSCIDQVHDYCVANDIDLVLFGGDMFHTRKQIPVQALNAVYNSMARFTTSKIPVFMIDGNHDQSDRKGTCHSLYTFQTFLNIAEGPGWYRCQGKSLESFSIMAVPYTEDLEHLRDVVNTPCPAPGDSKIFLGHLGVQGAKVGADFVYTNPHDPGASDLNADGFDVGFLGHYHLYQAVPGTNNFFYIGAPLQHNWGDRGQDRGFLVYDTETRTHEQIPLISPKFIKLTLAQYNKTPVGELEGHFVAVEALRAWSEDKREDATVKHKARSLEIRHVTKEEATSQRIDLPSDLSYEDVIENYVSSGRTNTDTLDDDYLISIGRNILQEAEAQE